MAVFPIALGYAAVPAHLSDVSEKLCAGAAKAEEGTAFNRV